MRKLSAKFFLSGDILYKRNHDTVLLKCVGRHEADVIIKEIHEKSFQTHSGEHVMAKKILRTGYY